MAKASKKQNKRVTRKKSSKTKKDLSTCFTIMPFGGWLDTYYNEVYKPAIEEAGLKPCRADDLYRPGTVVNDIWDYTQRAKILLADLTGKNANVFYELGLAHALAKPVILVTESIDDVPFDLRALRVIEYDKNAPDWGDILKEKLSNAIKEVLEAPAEAVLPAFLRVEVGSKKPTVTPQQKELIELKQDLDALRREFRLYPRELRLRGPSEALPILKTYLNMGLSDSEIIDRMSAQGAPVRWVEDKLSGLKKRRKKLK
jgi:hypothetical protein